MDETYAVTVLGAGGAPVQIGTATMVGDSWRISIGELGIGAQIQNQRQASPGPGAGAVFPNYGRSKGAPIAGASRGDLEYYAAGCRRTLDDPSKSRWHDKERVLLAAIEAEMFGAGGGQAKQPEPGLPQDESDCPF